MSKPAEARKPHSVWRAFAQPAAWTMLFFGFSSGLPFLLVAGTLAFWLKKSGIALADITVIASAGMAYALKFLWAPLLDHWKLPVFDRLGRRRGWLLFAQLGVVACLLGMVWFTPDHLGPFIAAALGVAFFGATQDIAVDAYRIEIAPLEAQGALVATYSLGYRMGLLLSFAIAASLADHMPWPHVYALMAAAMLIPIVANLVAREPEAPPSRTEDVARRAGIQHRRSFRGFFSPLRARARCADVAVHSDFQDSGTGDHRRHHEPVLSRHGFFADADRRDHESLWRVRRYRWHVPRWCGSGALGRVVAAAWSRSSPAAAAISPTCCCSGITAT